MDNTNNSALSKDIIFGASNHTNINSTFNIPSSFEELSVAKAKEALQILKNLETKKEAIRIFEERKKSEENLKKIIDQLPANITETPQFHQAKAESVELSDSARETFTRIGERAKSESLAEEIEALKKQFKQTFVIPIIIINTVYLSSLYT